MNRNRQKTVLLCFILSVLQIFACTKLYFTGIRSTIDIRLVISGREFTRTAPIWDIHDTQHNLLHPDNRTNDNGNKDFARLFRQTAST
jgi:hypothetical protein